MPEISSILIDLFLIFLAAKLAGELFERLGQPPVVGELLAGVLIGPHALGLIGTPAAELVTAFHGDAAAAAEGLPFVFGLVFMVLQPTERLTDAFTATTLVATSVGITARVMRDLGVLGTREAQIILGAAVIDDVLAMLLLAAVAALSASETGGAGGPWSLLILLGQAVGFVLFVVLVGSRVFRRYSVQLERLRVV